MVEVQCQQQQLVRLEDNQLVWPEGKYMESLLVQVAEMFVHMDQVDQVEERLQFVEDIHLAYLEDIHKRHSVEEAMFAHKALVVDLELVGLVEQLGPEVVLRVLQQVELVQWAYPTRLRLCTCLRRI
jgi:hypothetical protein